MISRPRSKIGRVSGAKQSLLRDVEIPPAVYLQETKNSVVEQVDEAEKGVFSDKNKRSGPTGLPIRFKILGTLP